MKKIVAAIVALCLIAPAVDAQDVQRRPGAFGFSFIFHDFENASRIRNTSLAQVLNTDRLVGPKDMKPGLALTYFRGMSRHMDFAGTLAGAFANYQSKNSTATDERFLLSGDASLNFKMFTEDKFFNPYLLAGVGANMYGGKRFSAFMPIGAGLKFNFMDDAAFFVTTQYRVPVTTSSATHQFFHQFGIAGRVGPKAAPALKPLPPTPPADTDKDGIIDSLDKCPTVPGLAKYNGCPVPDTDKDGINDEEDKCPTVAGLARYQGCPIPDTDKDGINDEEDKCITEAGPAANQGCPFVDSDGDGIPDPEDKCPNLPGTRENQGCPEIKEEVVKKINYAANNIYFATGKYVLLSKSFKGLNEVADIMKANPDLKLAIDGHTDNVGSDELNQKLSDNRAGAVKAYLVKKGIDESRLVSTGHGETTPVADNNTAAGRQKNRRVELKLNYF